MSTRSPHHRLAQLLRIFSDGREHTVDDLLEAMGGGIVHGTLRGYILKLRRQGHPIILLTGPKHAYRLLMGAAPPVYSGATKDAALAGERVL